MCLEFIYLQHLLLFVQGFLVKTELHDSFYKTLGNYQNMDKLHYQDSIEKDRLINCSQMIQF